MLTSADRIELDTLREENRQLLAALAPAYALPAAWALTKSEACLICALRAAAPGYCSHERLTLAIYGFDDTPGSNTVGTFIHCVRRKLRAHGIAIRTLHGQGYDLPLASCRAFDAAVDVGRARQSLRDALTPEEAEPPLRIALARTFRVAPEAAPTLDDIVASAIDAALTEEGCVKRAAERLQMGRSTLYRHLSARQAHQHAA